MNGDISPFFADVDFGKLAANTDDETGVPQTGAIDRIEPTHFELSQGADFTPNCLVAAANCPGQYQGQLQPYAIYVPAGGPPAGGYGLTLQLHSLSAMYNQYLGTNNQSQLGDRGPGSIVITPEARGPDEGYENYGAADVFDVWADVARHYPLDPDWTTISGYSMGAIGTFKLGEQYPDLFSRAFSTVGDEGNTELEANLRNLPILMWNNHGDELVNEAEFLQSAQALDALGYRYELDAFQLCPPNPACSPAFPNHLQLAVNDEYGPAATFLGTQKVDRDPRTSPSCATRRAITRSSGSSRTTRTGSRTWPSEATRARPPAATRRRRSTRSRTGSGWVIRRRPRPRSARAACPAATSASPRFRL